MSDFVLDCSVTMAWCFDDESSAYADEVLERLLQAEAVVPTLWPTEVTNVLLVAERRNRITPVDSAHFVALLDTLPIEVSHATEPHVDALLALGRAHELSAYDAVYLELALRRSLPIATVDAALRKACTRLGVSLYPPRPPGPGRAPRRRLA